MGRRNGDIETTARRAYAAGLAATLAVAVAGQLLLRRLPAGGNDPAAIREVGYLFTGLCMLGAFLLARRRQARRAAGNPGPEGLGRAIRFEYARIAGLCAASAVFGALYWGLGGRGVERHARTFLALGPVAFVALAPRPRSWARPPLTGPARPGA